MLSPENLACLLCLGRSVDGFTVAEALSSWYNKDPAGYPWRFIAPEPPLDKKCVAAFQGCLGDPAFPPPNFPP